MFQGCIMTKGAAFQSLKKELDISEGQLRNILINYQNETNSGEFPSKEYIMSQIVKAPNIITSDKQLRVWESKYRTPISFATLSEAMECKKEACQIFPTDSIGIKETADGKYQVIVDTPIFKETYNEMQSILANAPRNAEGKLLASNGKVSNLTEAQYAQVRTKAFKDWFGDWENANIEAMSFMPKRGWTVGKVIDNPTDAAGICDNTQIKVLNHIIKQFGQPEGKGKVYAKPVTIWAKSPINDRQIHHSTVAVRVNGEIYLYDMPQSEYIQQNSENNGTVVSEYTPRLIKYTEDNLQRLFGTSKENLHLNDESILDSDIVELPLAETSKVVDENGEPLVVYHYTNDTHLTEFSTEFDNYFSQNGGTKKAIFFTEDNVTPGSENNFLTSRTAKVGVFLNIKDMETYNGTKEDLHKKGTSYRQVVNESAEKNENTGGLKFTGFDDNKKENQTIYVIHNSNNVKSATANVGTFSTKSNNIYNERESTDFSFQQDKTVAEFDSTTTLTNVVDYLEQNGFADVIKALKSLSDAQGVKYLRGLSISFDEVIDSPSLRTKYNGRRAFYDASTKTIHINKRANFNNGNASSVIMHEIMHHLTVERLLNDSVMREKFQTLLDEYQKAYPFEYLADPHALEEFVADIWANPYTINRLKSIKDNKNTTLWDKFVSLVKSIFSGAKGTLLQTASEDMLELLSRNSEVSSKSNDVYFEREWYAERPKMGEHTKANVIEITRPKEAISAFNVTLRSMTEAISKTRDYMSELYHSRQQNKELLEESLMLISKEEAIKLIQQGFTGLYVSDENGDFEKATTMAGLQNAKDFAVNFDDSVDPSEGSILDNIGNFYASKNYPNELSAFLAWGDYANSSFIENWNNSTSFYSKENLAQTSAMFEFSYDDKRQLTLNFDETTGETEAVNPPYYEGDITPDENTIFVFGSNPEGRHGAGAAKVAKDKFGAIYGQGEGLQGNSYALPTKDLRVQENKGLRSIPAETIVESIKKLYETAKQNPTKQFKVAYRNTKEASLNGYTGFEMIAMFKQAGEIPANVIFSKEWVDTGLFDKPAEQQIIIEENGHKEVITDTPKVSELSKVSQEELQSQLRLVQQINALHESNNIETAEIQHIADQCAFWISEHISSLQSNPETFVQLANDILASLDPTVPENANLIKLIQMKLSKANDTINAIKEATSRKDVINAVGLDFLVYACRESMFGNNADIADDSLYDAADDIYNNFDGVLRLSNSMLLTLEGLSITPNQANVLEVNEVDEQVSDDTENGSEDPMGIMEEQGNLQEHWQVKVDNIMTSMSKLVMREIQQCQLPEKSRWGIQERVNVREAVSSILSWTQGCLDLSSMVARLKEKSKDNPWVESLIEKLTPIEGQENPYADFQGQFFGVFSKDFQLFSIVMKDKDGNYESRVINRKPALKQAMRDITVAYKMGECPMFTSDNGVNATTLETFKNSLEVVKAAYDVLKKNKYKNFAEAVSPEVIDAMVTIYNSFGFYVNADMVKNSIADTSTFLSFMNKAEYMLGSITAQKDNKEYDPFDFKTGINGELRTIVSFITDKLEDTAISSFYDNGKMYQSYVTPSYSSKLFNKFHIKDKAEFTKFLEDEYFKYEWFRNGDSAMWINRLARMSAEERTKIFQRKTSLNFNKHQYMRNMNDDEYLLSLLSEYFTEKPNTKGGYSYAWYTMPMQSNKPASEFIKFIKYVGPDAKATIVNGMVSVANQELARMKTVLMRNLNKKDPSFIKSFDTNGKKFCFLSFLNKYLKGGEEANSELGKMLNNYLYGDSSIDVATLNPLLANAIETEMTQKVNSTVSAWKEKGIIEACKKIANMGTTDADITSNLENYVWNHTFAEINILELMVTDVAYYKDSKDLQKRLAQLHAPGIRANREQLDYNGNRVTDGNFRTIILNDFDSFKSNVIDNVETVFQQKLDNASEKEKPAIRALMDSLFRKPGTNGKDDAGGAYYQINIADAQGYSSPTSYRKKAFLFGKWSKEAEEVYNKLKSGEYTYTDLQMAFQPLKPFVYSQIPMDSKVPGAPLQTMKMGIQLKNSEYLLIMADAILRNADTGKPNLLRAIYDIMEESADRMGNTRGIDTVQFESTTKTGLTGRIDLRPYLGMPDGEVRAKAYMQSLIYNMEGEAGETKDGAVVKQSTLTSVYNNDYVRAIPVEDYTIQQEVPEHFKDHEQSEGSQIRMIIPSDLEKTDKEGNTVFYEFEDYVKNEETGQVEKVTKRLTADEFRQEYEDVHAANIEASLNALAKELMMDIANGALVHSKAERNIALSKILQREILSNSRYGTDLLLACSVDAEGNFRIPLGDPVQSKRIEQLINSIIKKNVNKQEIAGGPIVQVSNFGTSKELNIRFKDRNGNILPTKEEFAAQAPKGAEHYNIDAAYRKFLKDNQASIAYQEVFVSIYQNELFKVFADKDGNIDIDMIERVNPDLLKMIGYRIPTEDKYSCIPLKVVGFLPREAGDGIMMPYDITLLTGSDFDVDKMYVMRKQTTIATRFMPTLGDNLRVMQNKDSFTLEDLCDAEQKYFNEHSKSIARYLKEHLDKDVELDAKDTERIRKEAKEIYDAQRTIVKLNTEKKIAKLNKETEEAYDSSYTGKTKEYWDKITGEKYERRRQQYEDNYQFKMASIQEEEDSYVYDTINREKKYKRSRAVDQYLAMKHRNVRNTAEGLADISPEIKEALDRIYYDYMYYTVAPDLGSKAYRDNKIVDMMFTVLTHPTTADKCLNPGGFEPQKAMGYKVAAFKTGKYIWADLDAVANGKKYVLNGQIVNTPSEGAITGIEGLSDLCSQSLNLIFPDVQVQYYKQNAAAATILGMFAVQKIAHATLEGNGIRIDIEKLGLSPFDIAGIHFEGKVEIDPTIDSNKQLIGKQLGSLVASAADAVKDPVLNLMNINNLTAGVLNTLIRMGMPFDTAAMMLSSEAISKALARYYTESLTTYTSFQSVVQKMIKEISESEDFSTSVINTESLSIEEIISGIKSYDSSPQALAISYKILQAYSKVSDISNSMKKISLLTRFNSITSAVGPLIIDNIIMEDNVEQFPNETFYLGDHPIKASTVMAMHPILNSFYRTYDMAHLLFADMPLMKGGTFKMCLTPSTIFGGDKSHDEVLNSRIKTTLFNDRKLLGQYADFYESYMLINSGVVDASKASYYINEFPKTLSDLKLREDLKSNLFIQSLRLDVNDDTTPIITLNTVGMEQMDKDRLSSAWIDLYKKDSKVALDMFYYSFFRGGVGFSPKTFMSLMPTYIKERIPGYKKAYESSHSIAKALLYDQFVRNNADNYSLVKSVKADKVAEYNGVFTITDSDTCKDIADRMFISTTVDVKDKDGKVTGKRTALLKMTEYTESYIRYTEVEPLGHNGLFIEMSNKDIKNSSFKTEEIEPQETPTTLENPLDAPQDETPIEEQHEKPLEVQALDAFFASKGRTTEEAKESFHNKYNTQEERESFRNVMIKAFEKTFKDLNIPFNKELGQKMFDELC